MAEKTHSRAKYMRSYRSAKRALATQPQYEPSDDSDDDQVQHVTPCLQHQDAAQTEFIPNAAAQGTAQDAAQPDIPILLNSDSDADSLPVEDAWDLINEQNDIIVSDTDSEPEIQQSSLVDVLPEWINKFQIKHNAVDALLKLLKPYNHPDLPSTARTLLKTDRVVATEIKSGMSYYYFGLNNQIRKHLALFPVGVVDQLDQLDISLHIDGLTLFKSTSKTVWPILCALHLDPMQVFPVTLTYGNHKPTDMTFMDDVIESALELMQDGLHFNDRIISINIRCIVCDAPARSMVKCTKYYSGYYGCERCNQKGKWYNKVTYPDTVNLVLRTDESFRAQIQPKHHKGISPFCELPINMVTTFPIDYMHQSCLGVMKRLLLIWAKGEKNHRLSANQLGQLTNRLEVLKQYIPPAYFARKPRTVAEVERWKATEFRQFLLYTGKVVLKQILRPAFYEHFMTLSVAMCILVSARLSSEADRIEYARELLLYFVQQGKLLYGNEFLVYNVHGLLHITSDVEEFGSLDMFSAFPFENYLHNLKKLARSGKNPLVQIVKRLGELDRSQKEVVVLPKKIHLKRPNNAYILSNTRCCEVLSEENQVDGDNEKLLMCRIFHRTEPYFNVPCNSSIIGVYRAYVQHSRIQLLSRRELTRPAVMIVKQRQTQHIFMAILHKL